jgi:hypothetical protein
MEKRGRVLGGEGVKSRDSAIAFTRSSVIKSEQALTNKLMKLSDTTVNQKSD